MMRAWCGVGLLLLACGCPKATRPATPDVGPLPAAVVSRCARPPAPTRVFFVDPQSGNDGANGSCAQPDAACGPWRSLAHAAASLEPGDAVTLAAGTYDQPLRPGRSGTADGFIHYLAQDGAVVRLTATADLSGRSHVLVAGMQFESPTGDTWLTMDASTRSIMLVGNSFESFHKEFKSFFGLELRGTSLTVCGNAFGGWLGDEVVVDGANGVLLTLNDFSLAASDHMLLQVMGQNVVVSHNVLRNPWQRTMAVNPRDNDQPAQNILIQNNLFLHSNWDREAPIPQNGNTMFETWTGRIPGMRTDHTGGGDAMTRLGGSMGVFRNNLLLGAQPGLDWPCSAALTLAAYDSRDDNVTGYLANRAEHWRVYHNTFHGNARSHLSATMEPLSPVHAEDNRFFHNVFGSAGGHVFKTCGTDMPWHTWLLDHNVVTMDGAVFHLESAQSGVVTGDVSMQEAQARSPDIFAANITAPVDFVDPGLLDRARGDFSLAGVVNLEGFFAAFSVVTPRAALAVPFVTTVRTAVAGGSTLVVEDARVFSSGFGVVEGDVVRLGSQSARVTAVLDAHTLELDQPVTAQPGDGVGLEALGATPVMGVAALR